MLSKPKWGDKIIKSFFGSLKTGLEHVLVFPLNVVDVIIYHTLKAAILKEKFS